MYPVRCIINCSTSKLLLLRGLPKRWKFAMKLRLISLTPFPLCISLVRSPLLAAMPEFLSGGVTRGLSIAEESSTLQPFPPSLPLLSVVRLLAGLDVIAAPQQHSVREIYLNDEKQAKGEMGGEEKWAKTGE